MFEQLLIVGNLGKDPEMRYTSAGAANGASGAPAAGQYEPADIDEEEIPF